MPQVMVWYTRDADIGVDTHQEPHHDLGSKC